MIATGGGNQVKVPSTTKVIPIIKRIKKNLKNKRVHIKAKLEARRISTKNLCRLKNMVHKHQVCSETCRIVLIYPFKRHSLEVRISQVKE